MVRIIIDGTGAVFGRVCSFAAKRALEGNEVVIVNSEKTIMTGNKKGLIDKYADIRKKGGHSQKGPQMPNTAHRILKRSIRSMVPDHRKGIGKEAFKRVKCYDGIPEELKDEKMMKVNAPKKLKFIELKELAGKI